MSPEQCRAARAWLNWSQDELAAKAQVSNSTLRDFEAARRVPIANNLLAIRRALEEAGMQFLFSRGDDKPWGVAKRRRETGEHEGQKASDGDQKRSGRPSKAENPKRRG
jgi:ribosome-binding protein aMBF1 (putative translation factor)